MIIGNKKRRGPVIQKVGKNAGTAPTLSDDIYTVQFKNNSLGLGTPFSSRGVLIGKVYFEVDAISDTSFMPGVVANTDPYNSFPGNHTTGWGYFVNGNKFNGSGAISYGASFGLGDRIGVAVDTVAGKIWWSKNGVFQAGGDPAAGTGEAFSNLTGTLHPALGDGGTGSIPKEKLITRPEDFQTAAPVGFEPVRGKI